MGRRVLVISAAACPVLLAACGGIPSSGGPFDAGEAGTEEVNPQVIRDLQPATEDMTADEIVGGFLDAMEIWEPPSGYPTAATFLTEQAQAQWDDPLSEIIVYEGDATTEIELGEETGTATLALDVEATYDRVDGFVRRPDGEEPTDYRFPLEQVGGEWRLAEPPNGLLIESASFYRYFSPHNLYFFNKGFDRTTLVPDPVYLPTTANQQTLLVQELLEGPSEWLAPAVETAFPEGTSLEPAAVTITGGDAMVTLSGQAVTRSDGTATRPDTRARMVTQLVATLGELRTVRRIQVGAGTTTLTGTDENPHVDVPTSTGATGLATRLYTVTESGISWVADGASPVTTPVAGPLGGRADVREVAINRSNTVAAAVTTDNQLVTAELSADSELTQPFPGDVSLQSLAWDGADLLWAIERPEAELDGDEVDNGGDDGGEAGSGETSEQAVEAQGDSGNRLLVMDPGTGEYADMTPQLPDGVDVEQFAIAPDGTRVALLADGAVFLAIVERDPERPQDPSAIRVSGMRELSFEELTTPVAGVAWYDSDELAMLTAPDTATDGIDPGSGQAKSSEPADPEVRLARIDELVARDDGPVPNGVSLAAPTVDDRLAVGTSENGVWIRSELGRWTLLEDATAPAYAG